MITGWKEPRKSEELKETEHSGKREKLACIGDTK